MTFQTCLPPAGGPTITVQVHVSSGGLWTPQIYFFANRRTCHDSPVWSFTVHHFLPRTKSSEGAEKASIKSTFWEAEDPLISHSQRRVNTSIGGESNQ